MALLAPKARLWPALAQKLNATWPQLVVHPGPHPAPAHQAGPVQRGQVMRNFGLAAAQQLEQFSPLRSHAHRARTMPTRNSEDKNEASLAASAQGCLRVEAGWVLIKGACLQSAYQHTQIFQNK